MSDLQLMLVGIVLLVVAVFFLWGTFFGIGGRRKNRRRPEFHSHSGDAGSSGKAVHHDDDEPALGSVDIDTGNDSPAANKVTGRMPADSPRQGEFSFDEEMAAAAEESVHGSDIEPEIIVINVCAEEGQQFQGEAVEHALQRVGMQFGEMNIFHHFGIGDSVQQRPVFSLANMLEPGAFDPQGMRDLVTTGLVMFMRLPAPIDEKPAFELMLNTADRLAEILGGELRDDDHQLLDGGGIQSLRRKLKRPDAAS